MLSNSANFQVRRAPDAGIVSGLVSVTAVRGLIFTRTYDAEGEPILTPATGKRGFHIERDVVTEIPLENTVFLKDFVHPVLVNGQVSARKVEELEAEGADLVLLSGVGAIANNTALGTEISTKDGKLSVRQNGQELYGYLRGIIPAVGGGDFRVVVETV